MAKSLKKKEDATKKLPKTAAIVTLVVLVVFLGAMFVNSNFALRNLTAVETSGVKFSAADASYFYKEAVSEYTNMVYSYLGDSGSVMLPQSNKSHGSQIHEPSGNTWEYFFSDMAFDSMKRTAAMYSEAMASGYTLSEVQQAQYDAQISDMRAQVVSYGYKDLKHYIEQAYGNTINEKDFLRLSLMKFIVADYAQTTNEELVYTKDDLVSYYNENKDALDSYELRYFIVKTEASDENGIITEEDMETAKTKSEGYITSVRSEKEFIEAARAYDEATYASDDSTFRTSIGEAMLANDQLAYTDWIMDSSRKVGDITAMPVTSDETNDRYYVLYFVGRNASDYTTKSFHELILTPQPISTAFYLDEEGVLDEEAYEAAVAEAEKNFEATVNAYFDTIKNAESSEAARSKLLEISNIEVGSTASLRENVSRFDAGVDTDVLNWAYAASRKDGDSTLIEDASGKYHLVLHFGDGMIYREYLADVRLRNSAYDEWQTRFSDKDGKITFFYRLRKTAI